MTLPEPFQDFIDCLEGVAYAVAPDETIIAIGRPAWIDFARANDAQAIADPAVVVGRNLFDFVGGDDVRGVYRAHLRALDAVAGTSAAARLAFPFRCDAPTQRREMRMAISPISLAGTLRGYLFQAVLWHEEVRPPMRLYDFAAMMEAVAGHADRPYLAMCSFCQRVCFPAGAAPDSGEWIETGDYYQRGGTEAVNVSHGMCPSCFEREHARDDDLVMS